MKKIISFGVVAVSLVAVSCLLIMGGYLFFEPEITIAQETSTSSVVVTLNVTEDIALTAPFDITMSPDISASANSSIGTGNAWKVITNASGGYSLTLHATATPALIDGDKSFADATTTSAVTWGFDPGYSCNGTTTCFGFSVYGNDVATSTWGNSTGCGDGGTPNANLNYRGFEGTTPITVVSSGDTTGISGTDTILCVAAAQNNDFALSGTYKATIVGTATTQ